MRVYPKGSWNVRIKATIEEFVDAYMQAYKNNMNYGYIANLIGCEILDVQFAEARIRKQGVALPRLNLDENNDDREVIIA